MSLHLLFRNDLGFEGDLEYEVSGEVPDSLIGYISGRDNPEPSRVRNWLSTLGMPYQPLYIPMFVYYGARPAALDDTTTGAWGQEFHLDPESVLPDLEIVCRDDI